jgi:Mg2+-importing ATPase
MNRISLRRPHEPEPGVSETLLTAAVGDASDSLRRLSSSPSGLDAQEAASRLERFGPNRIARNGRPSLTRELLRHALNPLNGLLLTLAMISWILSDIRAAIVISAMVVLSVTLAFVQEHRSNEAAAKLQAMVQTHASVRRPDGPKEQDGFIGAPMENLVPGDIVCLSAGDMIPADLRLLEAKDLFVNKSALTGESMPVEKYAHAEPAAGDALAASNLLFMGANVVSGYGQALVIETGARTSFGAIADQITGDKTPTSFEQGTRNFTWLMIKFITAMAPAVFVINGLTKGDWGEALLFAVSVAVGLTPEMLPMIITVNLAKGAIAISKKKVIVKRLDVIQNFGAMDVLCTDKTGTLTQDRIILKRHLDIYGEDYDRVLEFAYLNSHFQSGLRNLLDVAVARAPHCRSSQ